MMIKVMMLILMLAVVGLFFIKTPDGEPVLSPGDLLPDAPETSRYSAEPITVYKWRDEAGVWQFSNDPVDGQLAAEVLQLDGKINIMPAVKLSPKRQEVIAAGPVTENKMPLIPSALTSVSPEKISAMMETVNGLQDVVDKKEAAINKAIAK
ncbi:MAG: DUF4124 domain-containing protein [Pseudomonadales bacterium]|nr:DUF4124 domain-containing protein [Pseudomonadales bacterium]